MKKKGQEKSRIDLDLTSMLDVIFIILMVVMCQFRFDADKDAKTLEKYKDERDEAVERAEESEEEAEIYRTQLESIEDAEQRVTFLTVFVDFEAADPSVRHIRMLHNEDPAIEDITIRPETENAQYRSFESRLEEYLSENDGMPVLLTLNEERILYRDHEAVEDVLELLKTSHANLFVRYGED
ncbi:MAG: hypothetical protein K6F53_01100 [Lachnospiraceae bacterium]|nr:hypothetical protein [Lachnospiraceae bacterium]